MDIPYTVHRRRDTRMYNARLGIWLFLASEVMLFGALFTSYILLRIGADQWPGGSEYLSRPLGALNTVILVASSITMLLSRSSLLKGRVARSRLAMGATMTLGVIFLIIEGYEYSMTFSSGGLPSTNTFLAMYFTLTGLHALHVIAGLAVIAWLSVTGGGMWDRAPAHFTNRLEVAGLYWHFVDLVWMVIFSILYLM